MGATFHYQEPEEWYPEALKPKPYDSKPRSHAGNPGPERFNWKPFMTASGQFTVSGFRVEGSGFRVLRVQGLV